MFWMKLLIAVIILLSPWAFAAHKITEANMLATEARAISAHGAERMQDAIYMESHIRAVMLGGLRIMSTAPPQHRARLCRLIQEEGEWPFCTKPNQSNKEDR